MTDDKADTLAGKRPWEEAAQSGASRFDDAFLEYWQPICRVLFRLVGDQAEAEDLALETFWRLYRHPPGSSRSANLGGWLYRVATNLGLNALRARKRRERYERQADRSAADKGPSTDAVDALAAEEERARVRQVLSAMDSRQAQLLSLRHSGMTYKELAEALGVSANSIGTLLVRAQREFEKRYREKGE